LNTTALDLPAGKEIVVAVVDDGFRLSHNGLSAFLLTNSAEIPGNMVDDDHNGYIDDYVGWDVSDSDGNVEVPDSHQKTYYHGTFVSSAITQILSDCFGETAKKRIRILPVKALSDHAKTTAILDGYQGIEYAMNRGADIICCAWSGGMPTSEEKEIINKALQQDILMVGSAGNTSRENVDFPAATAGFFAIAALDTLLRKTPDSNYGMRIDLSLPGERVRAGHPVADNAWFYARGTSAAAAMATGCAAVLKAIQPEALPQAIIEALKNTARPVDSINYSYCGKLGAGLPDLSKAVRYLSQPSIRHLFFDPERPEGSLHISRKQEARSWNIKPWGAYQSVVIIPEEIKGRDLDRKLHLYTRDSLYYKGTIAGLKGGIRIPGSEAYIHSDTGKRRNMPSDLKLHYYVETIDSSSLYCAGTVRIEAEKGRITDNSGKYDYANNCVCTWHIYAPESTRIEFSFSDFDTEAKVDFVWLFDGFHPQPDNIIAKFSGSELPPVVTSRTNQVMLWFVTNQTNTAAGWELQFTGQK
jgi:hypothetical protein